MGRLKCALEFSEISTLISDLLLQATYMDAKSLLDDSKTPDGGLAFQTSIGRVRYSKIQVIIGRSPNEIAPSYNLPDITGFCIEFTVLTEQVAPVFSRKKDEDN